MRRSDRSDACKEQLTGAKREAAAESQGETERLIGDIQKECADKAVPAVAAAQAPRPTGGGGKAQRPTGGARKKSKNQKSFDDEFRSYVLTSRRDNTACTACGRALDSLNPADWPPGPTPPGSKENLEQCVACKKSAKSKGGAAGYAAAGAGGAVVGAAAVAAASAAKKKSSGGSTQAQREALNNARKAFNSARGEAGSRGVAAAVSRIRLPENPDRKFADSVRNLAVAMQRFEERQMGYYRKRMASVPLGDQVNAVHLFGKLRSQMGREIGLAQQIGDGLLPLEQIEPKIGDAWGNYKASLSRDMGSLGKAISGTKRERSATR